MNWCQFLIGMVRQKNGAEKNKPNQGVSIPYRYRTTKNTPSKKEHSSPCQFLIGMVRRGSPKKESTKQLLCQFLIGMVRQLM